MCRRVGISFDQVRLACKATVAVLARVLPGGDRERLRSGLPAGLHHDTIHVTHGSADLAGFLDEVARIVRRPPELARYQAQAVISAMCERDPDLLESLELPGYLADLRVAPPAGGGVVAPTGGVPPLTDKELTAALAELPRWSAAAGRWCVRSHCLRRAWSRYSGAWRASSVSSGAARTSHATATARPPRPRHE